MNALPLIPRALVVFVLIGLVSSLLAGGLVAWAVPHEFNPMLISEGTIQALAMQAFGLTLAGTAVIAGVWEAAYLLWCLYLNSKFKRSNPAPASPSHEEQLAKVRAEFERNQRLHEVSKHREVWDQQLDEPHPAWRARVEKGQAEFKARLYEAEARILYGYAVWSLHADPLGKASEEERLRKFGQGLDGVWNSRLAVLGSSENQLIQQALRHAPRVPQVRWQNLVSAHRPAPPPGPFLNGHFIGH